ncbi:MAG TPA: hypothetical protein VJ816_12440 [Gemmatimonadales bacterium]|nr:hypothetical protein [Gemmatimonadales bacterium]
MKDIAPAIAMSILIISIATVFVLRGPLGRALADRIAGRHRNAGEDEALRADLDETRQRLVEVEERLDFAERLLAKQRESDRVAPPR